MADYFEKEVEDTYKSHWCHQSYHTDCSECYKEDQLLKAHKNTHADLLKKYPGLRNPYGSHYPLGYRPE